MKKLLSMILVCILALSFAAFAEEDTEESLGTLKMGTNAAFPPYEYYDDDTGEIVGIDVEIAEAIALKLGYDGVEVVDMDFSSIITAVTTGKVDFGMAGMTVTEERQQSVDFTIAYTEAVQVVIVTEDSEITSVDDLFVEGANYTVGVQLGTTGDIYCSEDIADAGYGTVEQYATGADAVLALTSGKVDCVVIDNQPALKYVEANEGLKILDTEYATEEYAIALPKDSELTESFNTALQELIDDGTVQSIIDKYISADDAEETEETEETEEE